MKERTIPNLFNIHRKWKEKSEMRAGHWLSGHSNQFIYIIYSMAQR